MTSSERSSVERWLWVSSRWPLPANDGSKQATCSLVASLTQSGAKIDLLSFVDRDVSTSEIKKVKNYLGVSDAAFVVKSRPFGPATRLFNALSSAIGISQLPFTVMPFKANLDLEKLFPHAGPWSLIVFDGMHQAASFMEADLGGGIAGAKRVYRAHNVESELWNQRPDTTWGIQKAFLRQQAQCVKSFEQQLLNCCDGLATVSAQDLELFSKMFQLPASSVTPIGLDFSRGVSARQYTEDFQFLFVGNLQWTPNSEGLLWFLNEVWEEVVSKRSTAKLIIAGKGFESVESRVRSMAKVEFTGEVASLEPLYAQATAAIVPIFSGSGTRVKAIEASSYGIACVSTALGLAGLPLRPNEGYFEASTAADWVRILTETSHAEFQKIGGNAFEEMRKDFDQKKIAKDFKRFIAHLSSRDRTPVGPSRP